MKETLPLGTSPEDTSYALLLVYGEILDDLEKTRLANENRLRALTLVKGITHTTTNVKLEGLIAGLQTLEHDATLEFCRIVRAHPLGPWIRSTVGVGEKQGGRLLAVIGNPLSYTDPSTGTLVPRTVSKLWAYCGLHVIDGTAPRKQRGQPMNWNNKARSRAWLIAQSCIRQGAASPYHSVYTASRERSSIAVHNAPCIQCGTKGKPAEPGTSLRPGHQLARAMRAMSKQILKDLWIEAKRLETESSSNPLTQGVNDSVSSLGAGSIGHTDTHSIRDPASSIEKTVAKRSTEPKDIAQQSSTSMSTNIRENKMSTERRFTVQYGHEETPRNSYMVVDEKTKLVEFISTDRQAVIAKATQLNDEVA